MSQSRIKADGRLIPGVGRLHADEHWNILEEINSDAEKVKAVIRKLNELNLQATVAIRQSPDKAIYLHHQVQEGIELLAKLWDVNL